MSKLDHALREASEEAGCSVNAWKEEDGPDSRVGVDHWFHNEAMGLWLWVNDDQGHVTWQITKEDGDA